MPARRPASAPAAAPARCRPAEPAARVPRLFAVDAVGAVGPDGRLLGGGVDAVLAQRRHVRRRRVLLRVHRDVVLVGIVGCSVGGMGLSPSSFEVQRLMKTGQSLRFARSCMHSCP